MGEAEPLAGRVLAEKYLLIDRLGEGGFGSIWRAEHQVLRSPVAVKLIDLDVARRDGAVERFLREAQATAALRSPHVVQVLDYGVDDDQPFIVMELLEGETVAQRLERQGPLDPLEVLRIVTHVARAIGKAHELGIIHRDLKPENIFLVSNGDEEVAKVLDFGVAKIASSLELNRDTYTRTGSLIGTPYYMSPEQAQGNKDVDHRSDLWALGVIAFEMVTGKRPFDGDALGDLVLTICVRTIAIPSAVAPVPVGFDAWFARAVERDPDARFQSAREMALALLRVIEGDEAEIRFTAIDERLSPRPPGTEIAIAADIPSRPAASAFAATVRDDALVSGFSAGPIQPSVAPPPAPIEAEEPEEHLTPWGLFGIAVIALAAGAAAVYGAFFLLRAQTASDEPVDPPMPAISVRPLPVPAATASSKHRSDVTATNKPNSANDVAANRTQRQSAELAPLSTAAAIVGSALAPEPKPEPASAAAATAMPTIPSAAPALAPTAPTPAPTAPTPAPPAPAGEPTAAPPLSPPESAPPVLPAPNESTAPFGQKPTATAGDGQAGSGGIVAHPLSAGQ